MMSTIGLGDGHDLVLECGSGWARAYIPGGRYCGVFQEPEALLALALALGGLVMEQYGLASRNGSHLALRLALTGSERSTTPVYAVGCSGLNSKKDRT